MVVPEGLHVEVTGQGPPILLAHGLAGSARNFGPQIRALSPRFRVGVYDARGHARSPAPAHPNAYRIEALVKDLSWVAHSLAGDAPLVVVGLSLGAATSLRFALDQPGRVRGLILASYPGGRESPGALGGGAERFADAIDAVGLDAAGEQFVWGPASGLDEGAARFVRQGFLEHSAHPIASLLRGVIARLPPLTSLAADLRGLDLPVLVVAGADDVGSLPACRELAEHLPNARLVVVEGAGHVVNLAQPARVNEVLIEFLDGLAAE